LGQPVIVDEFWNRPRLINQRLISMVDPFSGHDMSQTEIRPLFDPFSTVTQPVLAPFRFSL